MQYGSYRSIRHFLPNNSLEHSASGAGPEILRQVQEEMHLAVSSTAREGVIPGRSLVPVAQAQAARSR